MDLDNQELMRECASWFGQWLLPGSRVADLGCGAGRDCVLFGSMGMKYVGVDISPEMVVLAKSRNPEGDFRVGDILDLSRMRLGRIDAFWSIGGHAMVAKADMPRALDSISKVVELASPGLFALREGQGQGTSLSGQPIQLWAKDELFRVLTENRFIVMDYRLKPDKFGRDVQWHWFVTMAANG